MTEEELGIPWTRTRTALADMKNLFNCSVCQVTFCFAKHSFIFQEIYSSLNSVYLVWLPCHFNGWMTPECAIVYRYLLMVFRLVTGEKNKRRNMFCLSVLSQIFGSCDGQTRVFSIAEKSVVLTFFVYSIFPSF
jgi:hypothetical protein